MEHLATYGPTTQEEFLLDMGADVRLTNVLMKIQDDTEAEKIVDSYERLISSEQMGGIYKVLAITNVPNISMVDGFGATQPRKPVWVDVPK